MWDGSRGLVFALSIDGSEQARNITDGVKNGLKGCSEKHWEWGGTTDKLTIASLELRHWIVDHWQGCGGVAAATTLAHL